MPAAAAVGNLPRRQTGNAKNRTAKTTTRETSRNKESAGKEHGPVIAIRQINKERLRNPVVPPNPAPGNPATTPSPDGGSSPLEGGDFPYTLYIDRMTTKLGAAFFRPQGTSSVVGVYFVIDRDGTIRDAKIESSSGNSTLDRAALRAVLESSPLGPLPFGYSGTYLGVHLKFR